MGITRVRLAAALAFLLAVGGCTGTATPAPTPTPTTTSATPAPVVAAPTISLTPVRRFNLGLHEAWPLVLTPTAVLAPVTTVGGADATQIWRLDLASGDQTVVAESRWPDGAIVGLVTTGDWIAWVDERRLQNKPGEWLLDWTVQAKNLASGDQIQLDTKDPASPAVTPPSSAPRLVSGDGQIGWSKLGQDELVHQYLWQPGQATPQELPLQVAGFDGASAIANGQLVGLVRSDDFAGRVLGLGNCWAFPLDGSSDGTQLTFSGLAQRCAMVENHLVWAEHIDLQAPGTLLRKAGDLPYQLISQTLHGTAVTRIVHQGVMRREGPTIGTDFAWWSSGGKPVITSLTTTAEFTVKNADKDFTLIASADGDQIAYQLRRANGTTVIAVSQVVETIPTPPATDLTPTSPTSS